MAKSKGNILAVLGVAIPIITSTLVYANIMGRQAEAIQQLGSQFTEFRQNVNGKIDVMQSTLATIKTEVRHNTELNKEQVDAYRAEAIASKVVNRAMRRGQDGD